MLDTAPDIFILHTTCCLLDNNIFDLCPCSFKLGIAVTKKTLKLYTDFYNSDIIIASPLGVRLVLGTEGEKDRNYDFLNSIEVGESV